MKRKIQARRPGKFLFYLAFIAGLTVFAQPTRASYPEITLSINKHLTRFNPPPQVQKVYLTAPVRGVAESIGATVYWNPASRSMTAIRGPQNTTVEEGNTWAIANGHVVRLTVAPYISGSRVYVPLTLFQRAFDATLYWDGVDHIASLETTERSYQRGTGSQEVTRPDYGPLKEKLQDYLSGRPGQVSLYIQDLSTGQSLDMGADQVYIAASTIKLPLVLYLYELAAQGRLDLNTKLTYTSQYYMEGSGILQGQPFGGQYTLRELARLAIEYSDNVAWQMLLDYLGQDNLTNFMDSLGGEATGMSDGYSLTSPRDMDKYLGALLVFRDEHPDLGNEVLYYMEHSIFKEGIPQDIPAETVVAHKMGALDDKWHDVGIVFAGQHPYMITIFSQEGWEEASLQTLATVSRLVYDFQTNLP